MAETIVLRTLVWATGSAEETVCNHSATGLTSGWEETGTLDFPLERPETLVLTRNKKCGINQSECYRHRLWKASEWLGPKAHWYRLLDSTTRGAIEISLK